MKCVLCESEAPNFFNDSVTSQIYFRCKVCDLCFLNPEQRLSEDLEKSRYDLHENNPSDSRYQKFLEPMAKLVQRNIPLIDSTHSSGESPISDKYSAGDKSPSGDKTPSDVNGLDFGCGHGPKLSMMLSDLGYRMTNYDPFYFPDKNCFSKAYDFIVATEVVEHLHDPFFEFKRLKNILKQNGGLGIMTSMYSENTDFKNWHYRRDPTHVCFYSMNTFAWLKESLNFQSCEFHGDKLVWLY